MSGSRRMAVPASRLRVPDSGARNELTTDAVTAVDAIFERAFDGRPAPGIVWGVVAGGELVHRRGLGTLRVGEDAPPDADSVFRIASMTKSFTAATVLLAARRGPPRPRRPVARTCPSSPDCRASDGGLAADHDPPPPDDVGRLPDRRSVGRPAAGPRSRRVRRAPARRPALRLGARDARSSTRTWATGSSAGSITNVAGAEYRDVVRERILGRWA